MRRLAFLAAVLVTAPFCPDAEPASAQDVEAPNITGVTITGGPIASPQGGEILCQVTATDNVGIKRRNCVFFTTGSKTTLKCTADRTTDTCTIVVPPGTQQGTWKVRAISVIDYAHNNHRLFAAGVAALPGDTSFLVEASECVRTPQYNASAGYTTGPVQESSPTEVTFEGWVRAGTSPNVTVSLSDRDVSAFNDADVHVRLGPTQSGGDYVFDAFNGTSYQYDAAVPWKVGDWYQVKIVANVTAGTFDAFAGTCTSPTLTKVADDYAFNTSGPGAGTLDRFSIGATDDVSLEFFAWSAVPSGAGGAGGAPGTGGEPGFGGAPGADCSGYDTAPPALSTSSPNVWANSSQQPPATGTLTFTGYVQASQDNSIIGIADVQAGTWDDNSLMLRFFNDNGDQRFDVATTGSYPANYNFDNRVPYVLGEWYSVEFQADLSTGTYDTYVGPCGSPRTLVAAARPFRSVPDAGGLEYINLWSESGQTDAHNWTWSKTDAPAGTGGTGGAGGTGGTGGEPPQAGYQFWASRTSCTSPCPVYFHVIDEFNSQGALGGWEGIRKADIRWDFGDGSYDNDHPIGTIDARGFQAFAVYELPYGEPTQQFEVKAIVNGEQWVTKTITVTAVQPSEIACVSVDSGNAGCPPGAAVLQTGWGQSTWDSLTGVTRCGGNPCKAILFERGDTFNGVRTVDNRTGPVQVGAYGSGPNPVISWPNGEMGDYSYWSWTDLSIDNNNGTAPFRFKNWATGKYHLIARSHLFNTQRASNVDCTVGALDDKFGCEHKYFVDNIIPDVTGTSYVNGRYWGVRRNYHRLTQDSSGSAANHVWRFAGVEYLIFQDNESINLNSQNGYTSLTIRGEMYPAGAKRRRDHSHYFLVQDNIANRKWFFGPQNTMGDNEEVAYGIVENNVLLRGAQNDNSRWTTDIGFAMGGHDIVFRNNLLLNRKTAFCTTDGCAKRDTESTANQWFYNNVSIWNLGSANSFTAFVSSGIHSASHRYYNNISQSNAPSSTCRSGGTARTNWCYQPSNCKEPDGGSTCTNPQIAAPTTVDACTDDDTNVAPGTCTWTSPTQRSWWNDDLGKPNASALQTAGGSNAVSDPYVPRDINNTARPASFDVGAQEVP